MGFFGAHQFGAMDPLGQNRTVNLMDLKLVALQGLEPRTCGL